jgi:RNA polymerase sigma-70 factor (ECF subfamily)
MTEQDYNNCVDEHSNGVYRFIVKNIRNTQDAEDIVQSAYEKLWVNRDRVTPIKAKSYLYTVAYHQMIDVIRKENKKPTTNEFMEVNQVTHQTSSELKQNLLSAQSKINNDISKQNSILKLVPYKERALINISRQQAIKSSIYSFLLEKREAAAISYASTVSDSRTIEPAFGNNVPISPKRNMILIIGLITGGIIALGLTAGGGIRLLVFNFCSLLNLALLVLLVATFGSFIPGINAFCLGTKLTPGLGLGAGGGFMARV